MLAFQLLQSGNAFKEDYAKSTEIYALEQGLKMMKTVNRFDASCGFLLLT